MYQLDYMECPVCGNELDVDTAVYLQGGDVVGCEHCVDITYPCLLEEDAEEAAQDAYENYLWDYSQERKRGIF